MDFDFTQFIHLVNWSKKLLHQSKLQLFILISQERFGAFEDSVLVDCIKLTHSISATTSGVAGIYYSVVIECIIVDDWWLTNKIMDGNDNFDI